MTSQTVMVGPWGGNGGNEWDDGSYSGVRAIELSHGDAIGTFNVTYIVNGLPFEGPKHVSKLTQFQTVKIELRSPGEYIETVSGFFGPLSWLATTTPVIRSLKFKTNLRTLGPYGTEEGTPFEIKIRNGLVVGFFGRSGDLLDGIGLRLGL